MKNALPIHDLKHETPKFQRVDCLSLFSEFGRSVSEEEIQAIRHKMINGSRRIFDEASRRDQEVFAILNSMSADTISILLEIPIITFVHGVREKISALYVMTEDPKFFPKKK